MTLEQVKEHFKDAKEVRCVMDEQVYSFDDMNKEGIHEFNDSYWFTSIKVNESVKIYDKKTNQLAEIITYKDKDMKITEQQVKDLDSGSTTARQLFPQVFATELEEGVWYKHKITDCLVLRNSDFNNFGFFRKNFIDKLSCSEPHMWKKANLEEVKQRMTEELVRLGFVKGCSFTSVIGYKTIKNASGVLDFEFFDKDRYWIIYIDGLGVFNNGKFATLIVEPTQKEILQAKIKEIQEEIDKL